MFAAEAVDFKTGPAIRVKFELAASSQNKEVIHCALKPLPRQSSSWTCGNTIN